MIHPPKWPAGISNDDLLAAIGSLCKTWSDGQVPTDTDRALIEKETGFVGRHLDEALARAFSPFTDAAARRMVASDRAYPDSENPWVLAILAGRIPALSTHVLISAMAARTPVLLRPPSGTGSFVRILVESMKALAPRLASAFAVTEVGSNTNELNTLIKQAPGVIAYGSDAVMNQIRLMRQGRTLWLGQHRESVVVVFTDGHDEDETPNAKSQLARAIARDIAIYNQGGCLSPHVVIVEGTVDSAINLATAIHMELLTLAARWPVSPPDLAQAAQNRLFVGEAKVLARHSGGLVLASKDIGPTVVVQSGPYRPGPGRRVVQVIPFQGELDLPAILPSLSGRLQGVAIHGPVSRWKSSTTRFPDYESPYVCKPGFLQRPPAAWRENGHVLVQELAALRPE